MAFDTIESSEFFQPVELYQFKRGIFTWNYTSADTDIVFETVNYESVQIRRGNITSTQDLGKTGLKLTLSRRVAFVTQFISTSPTDVITLTVTRIHFGQPDKAITWRGRVVNVKFVENEAQVTCQPIFNSLRRPGLRRVYQINCPHVLYGPECTVAKASFSTLATLTGVSGNVLTSPSFVITTPTFNVDWFIGGFVEFNNSGLFDKRFITDHNNTTGAITLNLPFGTELAVGAQVTAFPGCRHTTTVCSGKFNNIANYGGFPFIPQKNPMDGTPVF